MQFGKPPQLNGHGGVNVRGVTRVVDVNRRLPAFNLHPRVQLDVLAQALQDVNLVLVLVRSAGDEVRGGLFFRYSN
jgi:hypothetical protein